MSAWDGRPLNPERDGWHWLDGTPAKWVTFDDDGGSCWASKGLFYYPAETAHRKYGGPCLTPAEHAAAVQAERVAIVTDVKAIRCGPVGSGVRDRIVEVIRARGDTSALAAAVTAAATEDRA